MDVRLFLKFSVTLNKSVDGLTSNFISISVQCRTIVNHSLVNNCWSPTNSASCHNLFSLNSTADGSRTLGYTLTQRMQLILFNADNHGKCRYDTIYRKIRYVLN